MAETQDFLDDLTKCGTEPSDAVFYLDGDEENGAFFKSHFSNMLASQSSMSRLCLNLYGRVIVPAPGVISQDLSFWSIDDECRLEAKQTPDFPLILNCLRAGELPWILGISQAVT